jgi:hypothetical protein
MISMESNLIGYRRAKFNQPYKTISVRNGTSHEVLPALLKTKSLVKQPWLVWLDYDKGLDEEKTADIRRLIEQAPENTILLVTLPVSGLGKPHQRSERLKSLLGDVVPDALSKEDCKDEVLSVTLLKLLADFMASCAAGISRPGGFVRAFKIAYRDSTPMITVGGVLPAKGAIAAATTAINYSDWPALCKQPIDAPLLTWREAAVFQSQLPAARAVSRRAIRELGFDLETKQLRCFERYYRYYPIFAQVTT